MVRLAPGRRRARRRPLRRDPLPDPRVQPRRDHAGEAGARHARDPPRAGGDAPALRLGAGVGRARLPRLREVRGVPARAPHGEERHLGAVGGLPLPRRQRALRRRARGGRRHRGRLRLLRPGAGGRRRRPLPDRPGPGRDGALPRRARQGRGGLVDALRHGVGERGLERGGRRRPHDPDDEAGRLSAAPGRGDRGGGVERRPDHAAGDGRRGVPDRGIPRPVVRRSGARGRDPGRALLPGALRPGGPRGGEARAGRSAGRRAASARSGSPDGRHLRGPARRPRLHAHARRLGARAGGARGGRRDARGGVPRPRDAPELGRRRERRGGDGPHHARPHGHHRAGGARHRRPAALRLHVEAAAPPPRPRRGAGPRAARSHRRGLHRSRDVAPHHGRVRDAGGPRRPGADPARDPPPRGPPLPLLLRHALAHHAAGLSRDLHGGRHRAGRFLEDGLDGDAARHRRLRGPVRVRLPARPAGQGARRRRRHGDPGRGGGRDRPGGGLRGLPCAAALVGPACRPRRHRTPGPRLRRRPGARPRARGLAAGLLLVLWEWAAARPSRQAHVQPGPERPATREIR